MSRRRVGVVTAGALATGLLSMLAGAGPAGADPPSLTVSSPVAATTHDRPPRVTGAAAHSGAPIERIDLALQDQTDRNASFDCGPAPVLSPIPGEGRNEVSFDRPLPTLACNGQYELSVRAVTQATTLPPHGAEETVETRRFVLAAPPATPSGLELSTDEEARTVSLRWDENDERDLLGYLVERAHEGGEFDVVGEVVGAAFFDAELPQGGTYEYRVVAVRNVRSTSDGVEVVESDPSRGVEVAVSVASTTTAPGDDGDVAAHSTPPDTTEPAGAEDRLAALRQRAAARPAPRPRTATTVDTGFAGELPFDAPPPTEVADEPVVETTEPEGDLEGSVVADFDSGGDKGEVLVPIAGGLVLLMGALQLRYLARQAGRAATTIDAAAGAALGPMAGARPPRRRAEPLRARRDTE